MSNHLTDQFTTAILKARMDPEMCSLSPEELAKTLKIPEEAIISQENNPSFWKSLNVNLQKNLLRHKAKVQDTLIKNAESGKPWAQQLYHKLTGDMDATEQSDSGRLGNLDDKTFWKIWELRRVETHQLDGPSGAISGNGSVQEISSVLAVHVGKDMGPPRQDAPYQTIPPKGLLQVHNPEIPGE